MPPPLSKMERKTKFENGVYYERTGTHIGDAPWALPMESRLLKRHQFREELKTGMQKPKSNSSAIRKCENFRQLKNLLQLWHKLKLSVRCSTARWKPLSPLIATTAP